MLSEKEKNSKSTAYGGQGGGSLQSLNLGVLLVGQLSQAINWTNGSSFKKPDCKPWVDLPAHSSGLGDDRATSVVTPDQAASVPLIVEDTGSKVDDIPDVEVVKVPPPVLSSPVAEPLASERTENIDLTPPEIATPEVVAIVEVVTADPVETAPPPIEIAAEKLPADEEKVAFESKVEVDQSLINIVEPSNSPREVAQEVTAAQPVSDRLIEEKVEQTPIVEAISQNSNRVRPIEPMTNDEVGERPSKPQLRQSYQGVEKVPLAKAISRSPRVEVAQDDYLLQLERLVVELNMELARVRGEEATVDPIEQMANRIIALNLENLALREQLQQSDSKR
jgi:hypothetical protein